MRPLFIGLVGGRPVNRRKLLKSAAVGGGFVALAGGMWAHRAYAVYQLRRNLVAEAMPVLTHKAHGEFQSVPVKGREEIRRWFHGKVLNVAPFVEEICSAPYREKLHACRTEDEQHQLLLISFCGKVATDAEILNRVHTIAEEIGQELDLNWAECCQTISSQWNVHIKEYGQRLEINEFMGRVDQMVKQHLSQALEMARVGTQDPALGETIGNIGESALLVLPMSRIQSSRELGVDFNPLAIPAFVFVSLKHLFQYIIGLFSDPRTDLQRAISARVSLLGNRVGSEFESEMRTRLADLHSWQEQSVRGAAQDYADSVVGWL